MDPLLGELLIGSICFWFMCIWTIIVFFPYHLGFKQGFKEVIGKVCIACIIQFVIGVILDPYAPSAEGDILDGYILSALHFTGIFSLLITQWNFGIQAGAIKWVKKQLLLV